MIEIKTLEKLLEETEKYAYYQLELKKVHQVMIDNLEKYIDGNISKEDLNYAEITIQKYKKDLQFLTGKAIGLFISAMTLRKLLNLEIPKNENYQICFEDVLK